MKIKLWLASNDGGDGSFNIGLYNTIEEALKHLHCTEEEIKKGDATIEEVELDINFETGKLNKKFCININKDYSAIFQIT